MLVLLLLVRGVEQPSGSGCSTLDLLSPAEQACPHNGVHLSTALLPTCRVLAPPHGNLSRPRLALQRQAMQPLQGDHDRSGDWSGGHGAAGDATGAAQRAGAGLGDTSGFPRVHLLLLEPDSPAAGRGAGGRFGAGHGTAQWTTPAQPALRFSAPCAAIVNLGINS